MLAKSIFKIESVKNIYSADDMILMLDLGYDGLFKVTRCRLMGVDAPSTYNQSNLEGENLKAFVSKALNQSKESYVEVVSFRNNSWLVNLFTKDPETKTYTSINKLLMNSGYVFKRETQPHA